MRKRVIGVLLSLVMILSCFMGKVSTADAASRKTFYPTALSSSVALTNPYMGWMPEASRYSEIKQDVTLVYVPILWKDLQPNSKDDFKWDVIESKNYISQWKAKNVRFVIRFYMDHPASSSSQITTEHRDIPEWLYNEIGKSGTKYNYKDGDTYHEGFSPDYSNSQLQKYHNLVIEKIYNKIKNDKSYAFIEIGSLGHWGEYHTWPHKTEGSVNIYNSAGHTGIFPDDSTAEIYLIHYTNRFPKSMLCMRYPNSYAKTNKMGLFNDMFGDIDSMDSDGWGHWAKIVNTGMQDFWKYAPSGGEFANGDSRKVLNNNYAEKTDPKTGKRVKTDQKNIDVCIEQAQRTHVSWLGPCSPATIAKGDSTYQTYIDKLLSKMGYRFRISRVEVTETVKPGAEADVVMKWYNDGTAPLYYDWNVKIGILRNGSVSYTTFDGVQTSKWYPGSSGYEITGKLKVSSDLPDGEYDVVTCISDPITHEPGVNLAIEGKISNKQYDWYKVAKIKVSNSSGSNPTPTPTPTPTPAPDDDYGIDWSSISSSVSTSSQDARSIKVYKDSSYVYLRVDGNNLGESSQLYIDSDGTKSTGFKYEKYWPLAGMNLLVEGNSLYRHDAADSNWNWTSEGSGKVERKYHSDHIVYRIKRSLCGTQIAVGFVLIRVENNKRTEVCALPKAKNYLYIPLN